MGNSKESMLKETPLHKKEERLLIESEELYQSLLKYNPDGVCAVNLNGQIIASNPAYERMLGYSIQELSNMTFLDVLFPEDIPWAGKLIMDALNGILHADIEAVLKHKDGHRVHVNCTNVPVIINGEMTGIYAIVKDITNQKKTEAQLRSIIESAKDAIIVIDENKIILTWNHGAEQLFGYTAEERIGKRLSLSEHFYEMKQSDWFDGWNETSGVKPYLMTDIHNLINQTVEVMAVSKDGRETPVEISITSFGNGGETCFTGIIRDISERKRTDELLLKSEKLSAVGQLAAGVAHEIRNPMTALKGFTQLLYTRSTDDNRKYFEIMQGELNRIETILDELIVLAKPQVTHMKPRDIGLIIQEVITLLSPQAVMHNIMLELQLCTNAPMVSCDDNQLKQVFINVIKNGIEAMPSGGHIWIKINAENSNVIVQFIDEGEGIPKDRIPKLGAPFYTTKEKGTGLGLMMSHKIILAHQGSLEISSTIGKGTTVQIVLPKFIDAEN